MRDPVYYVSNKNNYNENESDGSDRSTLRGSDMLEI